MYLSLWLCVPLFPAVCLRSSCRPAVRNAADNGIAPKADSSSPYNSPLLMGVAIRKFHFLSIWKIRIFQREFQKKFLRQQPSAFDLRNQIIRKIRFLKSSRLCKSVLWISRSQVFSCSSNSYNSACWLPSAGGTVLPHFFSGRIFAYVLVCMHKPSPQTAPVH